MMHLFQRWQSSPGQQLVRSARAGLCRVQRESGKEIRHKPGKKIEDAGRGVESQPKRPFRHHHEQDCHRNSAADCHLQQPIQR
jgi:hypothetical protein